MSDNKKIYFGYPDGGENPLDGLYTSSCVVDALACLIGNCDDLGLLGQHTDGALFGLTIILDSVKRGIDTATEQLSQNNDDIIKDFMEKQGLPYAAMGNENMQRAWKDGFKFGQQENEKPAAKPQTAKHDEVRKKLTADEKKLRTASR